MIKYSIQISILTVLSIACSANSWAKGGITDGGGSAVVCKDADGKIKSAELFDLFEGRVLYGLTGKKEVEAKTPLEYAKKIWDFSEYGADLSVIEQKKKILPSGVGITVVPDNKSPIVPKGCEIVQAAVYKENGDLFIDGDIWSTFDLRNQAALLLHETIYKYSRFNEGAVDSIRTRKLVAHAFAGTPRIALNGGVPKNDYYECETKDGSFKFWMYQITNEKFPNQHISRVQFSVFNGMKMFTKTYADMVMRLYNYDSDVPVPSTFPFDDLRQWYGALTGISDVDDQFHSNHDSDFRVYLRLDDHFRKIGAVLDSDMRFEDNTLADISCGFINPSK